MPTHPIDSPRPYRVLACAPGIAAVGGDAPDGFDLRWLDAAALAGDDPTDLRQSPWRQLACRLAIEAGFDAVVLAVAGPTTTARVRQLADALRDGRAELVRVRPAGRGPVARLATRLTSRPPGPSAACGYAVSLLNRVPFELNADGPLFDFHLLLQAAHVGAATLDLDPPGPPTVIARPPLGWLATAAQFRLHRMGMLCALRYRNLTPARYRDKTFVLYTSHALALRLVRGLRPRTVLDIGCGPGFIAQRCRADGVRVTGLDADPPLPGTVDAFHRLDLERDPLPVDPFDYDLILLLDVLEHLADPEAFLLGLRNRGGPARRATDRPPAVIISTPNVAFAAVRLNLLLGRFTYAERGILDVTHKRLFTRRSLLTMLHDCGYAVERTLAVGPPFQTVMPGRIGAALGAVSAAMARAWPALFAFQHMVVARPRPNARQRLSAASWAAIGQSADASATTSASP